jgi:cell division protein FtsI (penicillin-binding protein 3)
MRPDRSEVDARPQRPDRDPRRIYVAGTLLTIGLAVVTVRLAMLQIVHGSEYAEQARRQYESKVILQADRGPMFDRNGILLASNAVSISFAVDPKHVENPKKLAAAFAAALDEPEDIYLKKMETKGTSFVWLKRKVSGQALAMLKDLEDDGLIKINEPLRHFEYASLGAQAIGCTDIDNHGLSGVELYYDEALRGIDGYMVMQRDAKGHRRPDIDFPLSRPEHGEGLVLTLDINVQGIVEDELKKGVERAGAESGTAIALDPRTGEILAIATYPGFDPNNVKHADPAGIRVRAITDTYEPGSTMKTVTAAAAIEEGAVTTSEEIDGEGGTYQLGVHTIRDDHPAGMMTFRRSFEISSDIAFAKIASRLPGPRFYKYVRDFGFGIISGVDLPGEARGEVKKPSEFGEETQAFMAFGYQLSVTPLQLVSAYAAVANGGVMMKPHLLKRRLNRDGEVVEEVEPQEIRQVISQRTADTLRDLLVDVVENGTGREARIPGLRIAGKTGTSQQFANGTYSKSKYNASFAGFFPADDPKVALLVLLDSPQNGYYGGQVAAPIFREIARRIVNATMEGSDPEPAIAAASDTVRTQPVRLAGRLHAPDLRGIDPEHARQIVEHAGLRIMVQGNGSFVATQTPAPGALIDRLAVVTVGTAAPARPKTMPDVRGMSLRRALNILNACRIQPRISGSGIVRGQAPAPATPLPTDSPVAILQCSEDQ